MYIYRYDTLIDLVVLLQLKHFEYKLSALLNYDDMLMCVTENGTNAAKFGDPAKTIYADGGSMRKANGNGAATQFMLSDLNNLNGAFSSSSMGNGTLGNGHVSTAFNNQPPPLPMRPHVTTNPLSAYDEQNEPFQDGGQVSHFFFFALSSLLFLRVLNSSTECKHQNLCGDG